MLLGLVKRQRLIHHRTSFTKLVMDMARRTPPIPEIELKVFTSAEEIDRAIAKLQRRINELEQVDFQAALQNHTGADHTARDNIRNTILDIYGPNSPEYKQHKHIAIWAGPIFVNMHPSQILAGGR